jgi:hypothetical protein
MEADGRRSLIVCLTLFGLTGATAAAPLIPEGKTVYRNLYPDRETCERDYAPNQCGTTGGGGGGGTAGGGAGRWRGPEYYADRNQPEAKTDPGPGRGHASRAVETSVRGGFGRVGNALRALG